MVKNSHGLETGLGLEKCLGVPKLTQVLFKFSVTSIQEGWGAEGKLSCTTLCFLLSSSVGTKADTFLVR